MAAQLEKSNTEATKKLKKSYFDVLGLCCSSEVPLIENILKSLDGVKEYSVIIPTRTVIVIHDDLLISQLQIGNYFRNFKFSFPFYLFLNFFLSDQYCSFISFLSFLTT